VLACTWTLADGSPMHEGSMAGGGERVRHQMSSYFNSGDEQS